VGWLRVGLLVLSVLFLAGCGLGGGSEQRAPSAAVLVAIAASDGVGIGATNPEQDNWVTRLGARLPSGSRTVNLAISGATAPQAATQELPVALDAGGTDVVVWLGVNDIAAGVPLETFSTSLSQIVGNLRTQTGARVYVGNIPDLKLLKAFRGRAPGELDALVASWNGAIAALCTETGAHLVDVFASWNAVPDRGALVSADGLHPTSAGYQQLADLFWQTMKAAG
jgi:lysophospholipase L1-like esterase